jgi:hypothetical protein
MPIIAFNSFTDGLEPNRRCREHFITTTNLEDDRLWVPYANGVWFQPCCFNVTSGGFSVVLKGLPGSMAERTTTLGPCMAIRCVVTGDTWSMTGLQSPELTSTNPPARPTLW